MQEQELCRVILRYLLKHPNAGDTVEGILDWWVRRELSEINRPKIQRAVEDLRTLGMLVEKTHGDDRKVYYLNRDKHDEIATFLHQLDDT